MEHEHKHQQADGGRGAAGLIEGQDAAGRSLTNALRVSFNILKVIMLALVVLFLASGVFFVQENEQALVLVFGKVSGIGDEQVLGPGIHFTWPEPISEVVRIPVAKVQSLSLTSFWYFQTEQEKLGQKSPYAKPSLDPLQDGYCLTRNDSLSGLEGADYNIVHSRWTILYWIDSPVRFFENVYYRQSRPGEDFLDASGESVGPLLTNLAEDAVVSTMVHYSIDDAITGRGDIALDVQRALQDELDRIESGIRIDSVRADRIVWPRQVDDAFQASNQARQEKDKTIQNAASYKDKLLTNTAGQEAERLLDEYKKDADLTARRKEQIVEQMKGGVQLVLSDARAYRTRVVEQARASASYLKELLPQYLERPRLVIQKLYQDTIEQVLGDAEEKILVQPGPEGKSKELRIMINRDPLARKKGAESQQQE